MGDRIEKIEDELDQGTIARPALSSATVQIDDIKCFDDRTESGAVPEDMVQSVKSMGILQPILVDARDWSILDGRRRYKAARAAGLKQVPVVCFERADVAVVSVVCNLHRSDMTPLERARKYQEAIARLALTRRQLASMIGVSETTVSNDLALLEARPEVQEGLNSGTVTVQEARSDGRKQRRQKTNSGEPKKKRGRKRVAIRIEDHLPVGVQQMIVRDDHLVLEVRVSRGSKWTGRSIEAIVRAAAPSLAKMAEDARNELDRK